MKKIKKLEKVFYVVVGVILVVSISVIMSVKAQSRSREAILFDNRGFEAAEEAYKQQVKAVLESYDCYNSGLTMTRIVSLDEEREYSIHIHNRKIQKLDLNTFEEMRADIADCKVILPDGREYCVQVSYGK